MPSVEYTQTTLISDGAEPKHPFEVRISKWLERSDSYHVHGFVEATAFGQDLAAQSDPWTWVQDNYTVADGLTELDVSEMVDGVGAVSNAELNSVLDFGNVSPVSAKVTSDESDRFNFEIVLNSAETFDIDWLAADFDPNRGGA